MESLGYENSRIKLALSRPSREQGLDISEIEKTLNRKVDVQIPNDERVVSPSVNKGAPVVLSNPTAKVSIAIKDLARIICPPGKEEAADKRGIGKAKSAPTKKTAGIFAWIFRIFLNG